MVALLFFVINRAERGFGTVGKKIKLDLDDFLRDQGVAPVESARERLYRT